MLRWPPESIAIPGGPDLSAGKLLQIQDGVPALLHTQLRLAYSAYPGAGSVLVPRDPRPPRPRSSDFVRYAALDRDREEPPQNLEAPDASGRGSGKAAPWPRHERWLGRSTRRPWSAGCSLGRLGPCPDKLRTYPGSTKWPAADRPELRGTRPGGFASRPD